MHTPECNVYWYGERGIVNAVLAHLTRTNSLLEGIKQLLSAVVWGSDKNQWVQDINEVSLVVEIGLADFGDPDLLIVCRTPGGTKLVFLEAKVISYTESMQSTASTANARWGMAQAGFNSSINGQLSLKYRFAKALSGWDGTSSIITEAPQVFESYRVRLNDSPAKRPGRTLGKPSILKVFRRLQLGGIDVGSCFFVALTWDAASHAFHVSGKTPPDCLPIFLGDDGNDVFAESLHQVGWIGYRELSDALGLKGNGEYVSAFRTMLDSDEPSISFYSEKRRGRWDSFPREIVTLADSIAGCFGARAQRWDGSYSIQDENKQTIAKIIPNDGSVFVGIREGYLPEQTTSWTLSSDSIEVRKVKNVAFNGMNVSTVENAKAFVEVMGAKVTAPTLPADTVSEPEAI